MMLQDILKEDGYRVLTAEDGVQAAIMAFEHFPDLIISDIEMPKMNGYQVCRLLKNDPLTSNISVIILTSKGSSGSIFWGYQTGADLYILKDFKPRQLTESIQALLEKYKGKNRPSDDLRRKIEPAHIMEKLNLFMDDRLFEMTLINEINKVTLNLTSLPETLTSLLNSLDKAIENHIIGFVVFSDEKDLLLSIKLNKAVHPKLLEVFQYQSLEDLAITVNKDISDYHIEVEVQEGQNPEEEESESSFNEQSFDPNLIYSIPIRSRDETFGLLNVYHPQMGDVSLWQKRMLEKLAPIFPPPWAPFRCTIKSRGSALLTA